MYKKHKIAFEYINNNNNNNNGLKVTKKKKNWHNYPAFFFLGDGHKKKIRERKQG